jgi:hypothetical protein
MQFIPNGRQGKKTKKLFIIAAAAAAVVVERKQRKTCLSMQFIRNSLTSHFLNSMCVCV